MPTQNFISASEAAKMAGVTTETIRNLCKAGTLTYQMHGNLFYPSREDVERYSQSISKVFIAEKSIEKLRLELDKEKASLNTAILLSKEQLERVKLFPQRIHFIQEMLYAVVRHFDKEDPDRQFSKREIEIMFDVLEGKSYAEIAEKFGIQPERTRQIWQKALRRLAIAKTAIRQSEEQLSMMQDELSKQKEMIQGTFVIKNEETREKAEIHDEMLHLLHSSLYQYDFPVRLLNGFKRLGLETVYDLVSSKDKLMQPNGQIGKKSFLYIENWLAEHNLSFGMSIESKGK